MKKYMLLTFSLFALISSEAIAGNRICEVVKKLEVVDQNNTALGSSLRVKCVWLQSASVSFYDMTPEQFRKSQIQDSKDVDAAALAASKPDTRGGKHYGVGIFCMSEERSDGTKSVDQIECKKATRYSDGKETEVVNCTDSHGNDYEIPSNPSEKQWESAYKRWDDSQADKPVVCPNQ